MFWQRFPKKKKKKKLDRGVLRCDLLINSNGRVVDAASLPIRIRQCRYAENLFLELSSIFF